MLYLLSNSSLLNLFASFFLEFLIIIAMSAFNQELDKRLCLIDSQRNLKKKLKRNHFLRPSFFFYFHFLTTFLATEYRPLLFVMWSHLNH